MTAAPLETGPLPLPRREAASPTDQTERLADYGLLANVLNGLTGEDLESCPGVLVVHADGSTECLDADGCPPDLVLHAGAVPCAEAGLDCC